MRRGGSDEAGTLILVEVILVAVIVLAVGLPLMMGARSELSVRLE